MKQSDTLGVYTTQIPCPHRWTLWKIDTISNSLNKSRYCRKCKIVQVIPVLTEELKHEVIA